MGGIAAALGMAVVFAAAAWFALQRDDLEQKETAEIPLVKVETGPVKEKPEDPGGLKIPNQDKLVYERITPKAQAPVAEKLAPAPEEPIVKTVDAGKTPPAAPVIAKPAVKEDVAKEDVVTADVMAEKSPAKAETAKPVDTAKEVREHMAPPAIADKSVKEPESPPKTAAKMAEAMKSTTPAAVKPPVQAATVAAVEKTTAQKPAPAKIAPEKTTVAKTAVVKASRPKTLVAKTAPVRKLKWPYRIQMASYRTAKRAAAVWQSLLKAHGEILGSLIPHTERIDLGKRGVYHRVQAGDFNSAGAAKAACAKLKAKGQDCIVVRTRK